MCAAADLIDTKGRLTRLFDADWLNFLANHPAIRPTCGGDGVSPIDLSEFVANPKNHAVGWDKGAYLFQWSAPQTYEVHIMVLPEGRGRAAYRMARKGIGYMVAEGAERLWARVCYPGEPVGKREPNELDGLRHYTRAAGFNLCGRDTLNMGFGLVAFDLYQWKRPCHQQ